jgi:formylglycine-generating enzyme required for sulfatase activity
VGGPVGRVTPRPLRRVLLDSFYLDVTEVTIADYARFLGARAGRVPWRAVADSQWPVTGVLWTEADAYCRWTDAAGRLPTEDEWEAAARGAQSRRFPWGASMERFRANVDTALDTLVAVGSFPRGASPFGVFDLVGNAWEWTATADTARNGTVRHIIKGGAFNSLPEVAQPAFRIAYPDTLALVYNTGFRCARPVRR